MAIQQRIDPRLAPLIDEVARQLSRRGIEQGDPGDPAVLRIELEDHVRRMVQVYWTPFEANIPGQSIGLHLEVAEPRVHWAECYLNPEFTNWYFAFHERDDSEIQLAYYREYNNPYECLDAFFKISGWYVLTATDKSWADVRYTVAPDVPWTEVHEAAASVETDKAIQESIKKSTIVWLRYSVNGTEHTLPVWFITDGGKLYVLSGEREQTLPGAEKIRRAEVIFRWKGQNARVGEVTASVRALEPGPEWDQIAEKIAEKRLNIPGLPEDTARRWRDECQILELTLH